MKTIQLLSTFFFLLLTIPAFLYLTTRNNPEKQQPLKIMQDSVQYNLKTDETAEATSVIDKKSSYKQIDKFPLLKSCLSLATYVESKECTDRKLLALIKEQLVYPDEAIKRGVEGSCILSFIVDSSGFIRHIDLVKDIGAGCGEAALNALQSITEKVEFIAAEIDGKAVDVKLTVPVGFELGSSF